MAGGFSGNYNNRHDLVFVLYGILVKRDHLSGLLYNFTCTSYDRFCILVGDFEVVIRWAGGRVRKSRKFFEKYISRIKIYKSIY